MSDQRNPLEDFVKGFKEGYDEQDARIEKDNSDNTVKVKEGLASGSAEGLANPFNWLKSLVK